MFPYKETIHKILLQLPFWECTSLARAFDSTPTIGMCKVPTLKHTPRRVGGRAVPLCAFPHELRFIAGILSHTTMQPM